MSAVVSDVPPQSSVRVAVAVSRMPSMEPDAVPMRPLLVFSVPVTSLSSFFYRRTGTTWNSRRRAARSLPDPRITTSSR